MVISWIYWAIVVLVIMLTIRCLYKETSLREQLVAAMVLVPLVLRVFFIK